MGYRHGTTVRTVTSPVGAVTVTGPRARLQTPPAGRAEWESQVLPAYARRMRPVNAALRRRPPEFRCGRIAIAHVAQGARLVAEALP